MKTFITSMLHRKTIAWLLVAGWICGITLLSSLTPDTAPELPKWEIPHLDKIVHFVLYAIGGFVLANALWVTNGWPLGKVIFVTALIALLIGVGDEFHQSFVPERSGNDWGDIMADFLGAIAGAIVYSVTCHALIRKRPASDRAAA